MFESITIYYQLYKVTCDRTDRARSFPLFVLFQGQVLQWKCVSIPHIL